MDKLLAILSLLGLAGAPDAPQTNPPPLMQESSPAAPSASPHDLGTAPSLACALQRERRGGHHVIVASVRSTAPVRGTFELTIAKTDARRNVMRSVQGGELVLQPGKAQLLADASFNTSRGENINAELAVHGTAGTFNVKCQP